MNKPLDVNADSSKSISRGASRDMTPDAISRRLDIVDELREFARELRDSTRNGPIGLSLAIPETSDIQTQTACEQSAHYHKKTIEEV